MQTVFPVTPGNRRLGAYSFPAWLLELEFSWRCGLGYRVTALLALGAWYSVTIEEIELIFLPIEEKVKLLLEYGTRLRAEGRMQHVLALEIWLTQQEARNDD